MRQLICVYFTLMVITKMLDIIELVVSRINPNKNRSYHIAIRPKDGNLATLSSIWCNHMLNENKLLTVPNYRAIRDVTNSSKTI